MKTPNQSEDSLSHAVDMDSSVSEQITAKVLSLNIWGIVGVSKNRLERLEALGHLLAYEVTDLDFVFLQEVWSASDFQRLVETTRDTLPYSHYFHSGVMGSGVCVLSKWPIIDSFSYKYNLNGYAHKFHHGDWFGGKVVGMLKVRHHSLIANLYVTHLHAEYNRLQDVYLYHRVSQAFEFSQFVSHTSLGSCDYTIVAGDFNTQPQDLPYKVILYNSRLRDSFVETKVSLPEGTLEATCGHPRNVYTSKYDLKENPNGQRIDYILFGEGTAKVSLECKEYSTPNWKTHSGLPVSDHEAVMSVLRITKTLKRSDEDDPMAFVNFFNDENLQFRIDCLRSSAQLMEKTMESLRSTRIFFLSFAVIMLILLLASLPFDASYGATVSVVLHIARIVGSLFLGFFVLMGVLWNPMEERSVLSTKEAMESLLKFLVVQSESNSSMTA